MADALLTVEDLTKSFGDKLLFEDISFGINAGQKSALIARNGYGKSTLLTIIMTAAGQRGYNTLQDAGKITFRGDLKLAYLPQSPEAYPKQMVRDFVYSVQRPETEDEWTFEQRMEEILSRMKVDTLLDRQMETLSGGEQKKVALCRLLMDDCNLLILDEPTNHLDVEMIEWLETYLSRTTASLLMVTHDRYFLDRVCNSIIEMDNSTIYRYEGNYSYYLQKRQERLDQAREEIVRANNLYRTELEWMRRMPQARGHKARYREEAFYELEKVAKRRIDEQQVRLEMGNRYIGSKIFVAEHVSKAFGEKTILKDFNYSFSRYEKMGIAGNNGTGKSTFIKLLLGELAPDEGHFDIGETVRFGYYCQDGIEFRDDAKVIDMVRDIAEVVDMGNGQRLSVSQFLQHFLFEPEQQYNYVGKLSGGEKRRLYLCTVLMKAPNFLILDEPTNDLDIITLQILEDYLAKFKGCLIVVSHDRYFMDKVVDHLLVFEGDGRVKDFPGNYREYRAKKEEEEAMRKASKTNAPISSVSDTKNMNRDGTQRKRKMSYKEKKEFEQLEKDLAMLEAEKRSIEEGLSSGKLSVEQITQMSKRLPILQDELDEKEMRWLELSEME